MKNGIFTLAQVALFASSTLALAAPESGLRLIQTAPGQRHWMNQAQIDQISEDQHRLGKCGGFMDVTDIPVKTQNKIHPLLALWNKPAPTRQEEVGKLLGLPQASRLLNSVSKLSSFKTRYYKSDTGLQSAQWIKSQFESMAQGRKDVTVSFFQHRFKQPSVIARIQGKGELADEIVIIGAHQDSINRQGSGITPETPAPGADDDASGIATVLETFRVLMESGFQPDRTLEFMAYAGEEAGLLGSQDIAENYAEAKKKVVGALQMDMTMYPGKTKEMSLIEDHVSPELTTFTAMLIDTYLKMPWQKDECGYACSDHASWDAAGYPSVFPFESPFGEYNPKIHTTGDTIQNSLDMDFGLHFAKLCIAFAVEMTAAQ